MAIVRKKTKTTRVANPRRHTSAPAKTERLADVTRTSRLNPTHALWNKLQIAFDEDRAADKQKTK